MHVKAPNKTQREFKNTLRAYIMTKLVSSRNTGLSTLHKSMNIMGHVHRLKDRLTQCWWKYKPVQEIRVKVSQLKTQRTYEQAVKFLRIFSKDTKSYYIYIYFSIVHIS